ncbi:MAG: phosphoribosylformylglycinamidine synthase subunit PurS [Rickettsiales bacterium]
MKATVHITLKNGVLDPQGKAINNALHSLGFSEVENVRVGKFIEVEVNEKDKSKAEQKLKSMCDQLLANTVIENYKVEIA